MKMNFKLHELLTYEGREIFRLVKILDGGRGGELECVHSDCSRFHEGQTVVTGLCCFSRIDPMEFPKLQVAIRQRSLHLHLTPEGLSEVIRQAYEIGRKDANDGYPCSASTRLSRVERVSKDIDGQLIKGPLSLYKYPAEYHRPSKLGLD
ncbi:hypothetical protein [Vibrio splendidus]|uniref:hypothetical protein n=1 Tax=Vibrio splendidus TaxID=29497 RepID=UPI000C866CAD|nr:hypothetical protein [Vibrio splendidus]PMP51632.1 hypothetical protein BCS83_02195 [Vibrio splendidus]